MRLPESVAPKASTLCSVMIVGMKSIKNSMIKRILDKFWQALEDLLSMPDDAFDFKDDENAIIEE